MRQPLLFMDLGDGWKNLTGHEGSVCSLADFSIEWGTDTDGEQPDVDVLGYTLMDRTGGLAGNATVLAGALVWIQLSRMPVWSDVNTPGTWEEQPDDLTWDLLHLTVTPDLTAGPDPSALTMFKGRIATGGTVTQLDDGGYRISLTANSLLTLAKRTTTQGPTSTDTKFAGYHWTGTTSSRIDVIQQRLEALGCPVFDQSSAAWLKSHAPSGLAAYDSDSYPELLTIIHNLASSSPLMPMVYEAHEHGGDTLRVVPMGEQANITMHGDGSLTVYGGGMTKPVIQGEDIQIDAAELSIPDPVSGITLNGYKVGWDANDNRYTFQDEQQSYTSMGLMPANLAGNAKTISIDSDAVISDETDGRWTRGVYQPTQADRQSRAQWLSAQTMRLRPQELTVDSRDMDIDTYEQAFMPTAIPFGFIRNRYTKLVADDGTPATSGAWMGIGGEITFKWQGKIPVIRNQITLSPLPMTPSTISTWDDLAPINLPWTAIEFTWGEFSQITYFTE